MDASASQFSRTSRDRPLPSDPTTSTSPSVANGRSLIAMSPSPASPTTKHPAWRYACSVRTRLVARATGTRAAAPEETFQADAVTPAERRSGTTTPFAPNAPAERSTAPRLRGSVTPSSATMSGFVRWSDAASSRSSGSAYTYGGTWMATPWWMAPSVSRSSSALETSSSG